MMMNQVRHKYWMIRHEILDSFWKTLYKKFDEYVFQEKKMSNVSLYHKEVLKLLHDNQNKPLSEVELIQLQLEIEDLTMNFDEHSVFKSSSSMIKLLVGDEMITAQAYITQKKLGLSEEDLSYINVLGIYTLEAIIIHVLGSVFNSIEDLPVVRVSTLIDQLDTNVRVQAKHMGLHNAAVKKKKNQNDLLKKDKKRKVTRGLFAIGVCLVELLVERKLITIKTEDSYTDVLPVSNKKGHVFLKNKIVLLFAILIYLSFRLN